MLRFLKWYLANEYLPDKRQEKWSVIRNKLMYFILFVLGFIAFGFFNGFEDAVNKELNDPYANSIPVSARLLDDLDTLALRHNFPELQFDKVYQLGYSTVLDNSSMDTVDFVGIAIPGTHPYFSLIERQSIKEFSTLRDLMISESALNIVQPDWKKKQEVTVNFSDLGLHEIKNPIPVSRVCKNLPLNMDFIMSFHSYQEIIDNSLYIDTILTEPSPYWEIAVNLKTNSYDSLFYFSETFNQYLSNSNEYSDAICSPKFSGYIPATLNLNMNIEASFEQLTSLVEDVNQKLFTGRDSVWIHLPVKRIKIRDWKIPMEWRYFTMTTKSVDKRNIFEVKNSLDKNFPGLKMEMKGFNMVYALGVINDRITFFKLFVFLLILLLSLLINYQTLNHHIFRRRQNIGYLKTVGIEKRRFVSIYFLEGLMESILFFIGALVIAILANFLSRTDQFTFTFDDKIIAFSLGMMLFNVVLYSLVIKKYLKQEFRELLES